MRGIPKDSGPSGNDFARGYSILVSNNGTDWSTQTAVASGAGTSAVVTANFATQNARFVRIVQTGSDSFFWWSMAEVNIGTTATAASAGKINFQVVYTDGSGVNADSLGNSNIQVTGPNGFSQLATLVGVNDPSTNYGYHVATYSVTTPGAVGPLSAYTFSAVANGVTDTVGNAVAAGKLSGPSPMSPVMGDLSFSNAYEVGDLSGQTWQITDEAGPYYQGAFFASADYHFNLSSAATLSANLFGANGQSLTVSLFRNTSGDMQLNPADFVRPTSAGVWNVPAGQDYYFVVGAGPGDVPYGNFTLNVSATGTGYDFGLVVPGTPPPKISKTVTTNQNTTTTGNVAGAVAPTALAAARNAAVAGDPTSTDDYYYQLIPDALPGHAFSFTLDSDGTYSYTPDEGFHGADSFSYLTIDEDGNASVSTVTINVMQVNQPPEVQDESSDSTQIVEGNNAAVDLRQFVTDPDSSALTFKIGKVIGGTAKLLFDGCTLVFTPSKNFVGTATVNFTATDGAGLSTTTACLFDVSRQVLAPTAKKDAAATLPSTAITINPLANDYDSAGLPLQLVSVQDPAHGSAYIDTRGSSNPKDYRIIYRPDFGFHGTDTFQYTVANDYGIMATAKISVTIKPGVGTGIDPNNPSLKALDILGTTGSDKIKIANCGSGVSVLMNGKSLGTFYPTGLISADGGGGNDTIDASGVKRNVALFGGSGSDTLYAGSGKSVLVGGAGKDWLVAGQGTDGIIAGTADYSKGLTPYLNLFTGSVNLGGLLKDDGVADQIYCGKGNDTIWAKVSGRGIFDVLHDRLPNDLVIAL